MQSPIDILQYIDNEKMPVELKFNGHGDERPQGFSIQNVGNTGKLYSNSRYNFKLICNIDSNQHK